MSTSDILTLIDRAIESTYDCAWCQNPLTEAGPSLYFCGFACQTKWGVDKWGEADPDMYRGPSNFVADQPMRYAPTSDHEYRMSQARVRGSRLTIPRQPEPDYVESLRAALNTESLHEAVASQGATVDALISWWSRVQERLLEPPGEF